MLRLEEAEPLYRRALAGKEAALGQRLRRADVRASTSVPEHRPAP